MDISKGGARRALRGMWGAYTGYMPLLVDVARLIWKLPVEGIVWVRVVEELAPTVGGTTILIQTVGENVVLVDSGARPQPHIATGQAASRPVNERCKRESDLGRRCNCSVE